MNAFGVFCIKKYAPTATIASPIRLNHLNLIKGFTTLKYLLWNALNPALKELNKRSLNLGFFSSSFTLVFRNIAHNTGLKVNAFTAEIRIATASVNANC